MRTVKPELAVVDAVAAHLVAHVLYPHARHHRHVLRAWRPMHHSSVRGLWRCQVALLTLHPSCDAGRDQTDGGRLGDMPTSCRILTRKPWIPSFFPLMCSCAKTTAHFACTAEFVICKA